MVVNAPRSELYPGDWVLVTDERGVNFEAQVIDATSLGESSNIRMLLSGYPGVNNVVVINTNLYTVDLLKRDMLMRHLFGQFQVGPDMLPLGEFVRFQKPE